MTCNQITGVQPFPTMNQISQSLTAEDQVRYSRQLNLCGFGADAQLRLKNSRVAIVGAGGLGCPIAMYLAGTGVGFISVIDHDNVELSNIHRQVAYKTSDLEKPKSQALVDTMRGINPNLEFECHNTHINDANAHELLRNNDLVIDGTDNFASKFLIADTCYSLNTPLLYGSVHQYSAQIILLGHEGGPCLRCLYQQPPTSGALASCEQAGVLGVVAGTAGMLMATEAVKFLSGVDRSSVDSLMKYDALPQSLVHFALQKDPDCPACSSKSPSCQNVPRHRQLEQPPQHNPDSISVQTAAKMIEEGAFLLDVREISEYQHSRLPNAVLIPLATLPAELTARVPRDKNIVVYCAHGVRSLAAVNYMRSNGYENSYSIAGGIAAWPQPE